MRTFFSASAAESCSAVAATVLDVPITVSAAVASRGFRRSRKRAKPGTTRCSTAPPKERGTVAPRRSHYSPSRLPTQSGVRRRPRFRLRAIEPRDHERDIVRSPPLFRERNKALARRLGRRAAHHAQDLRVLHEV